MNTVLNELNTIRTSRGVTLSYEVHGSSTETFPLVLVHGGFSDHRTNWEFVLPSLTRNLQVYAVARRGRGETDNTPLRRLEDEALDVAELIKHIGTDVFLLGHSYGAHVALLAAAKLTPGQVRKLILYEPPAPGLMKQHMDALTSYAHRGDWSGMSYAFFRDVLQVPVADLDAVKNSELWQPIVADAEATLGDLKALSAYDFHPEPFRNLRIPVMLQVGSESPSDLYATNALAAALPNARLETLSGQAHEGMTTAPEQYVESVLRFLGDQNW